MGSLWTSLWLDEILYYYLQDDLALRASEIGRPASAFAPFFSNFFFCDLQQFAQALLHPLGLTVLRAPEATLRILPLASFVASCLVFYRVLRSRTGRRADAVLGTLAFSSMPLVLHYAFEARVYAFTTFLALLLVRVLDLSDEAPTVGRTASLVALGLVTAHSHLWTVCLFVALAGDAVLKFWREHRVTPAIRARLAASLPAMVLVAAEWLFMKLTDPGQPLYLPFQPQPIGMTIRELLLSNFAGPMATQYVPLAVPTGTLLSTMGAILLCALTLNAFRSERGDRRRAVVVALAALGVCFLLAVTVGYYQHARYHLPLLAVLLLAVAPPRGFLHRGLLAALLLTNVALLPDNLEEMSRKSDAKRLSTFLLNRFPDRAGLAVLLQNLPTGGYPFPSHSIGLDFYLNVLHPGEREIVLSELPGLDRVNGRRGVYDFFTSDSKLFQSYLESRPDVWRRRLPRMPTNLVLIHPVWGIEGSRDQLDDFARILYESRQRILGPVRYLYGFPHSVLIELPTSSPPNAPAPEPSQTPTSQAPVSRIGGP
jgi:hypothetical protein